MHSKSLRNNSIFIALTLLIALFCYFYFKGLEEKHSRITSFEKCVAAGFPILESYPEQCKMPGKTFVNQKQEIATRDSNTLSRINFPTLSFIVNGMKMTSSGSGTSTLIYETITYEGLLNKDINKDRLFVAKNKETSSYYLLLALGLYNGSIAPANGIVLGKEKVVAITATSSSLIEVLTLCSATSTCKKTFKLGNDILEEIKRQ